MYEPLFQKSIKKLHVDVRPRRTEVPSKLAHFVSF